MDTSGPSMFTKSNPSFRLCKLGSAATYANCGPGRGDCDAIASLVSCVRVLMDVLAGEFQSPEINGESTAQTCIAVTSLLGQSTSYGAAMSPAKKSYLNHVIIISISLDQIGMRVLEQENCEVPQQPALQQPSAPEVCKNCETQILHGFTQSTVQCFALLSTRVLHKVGGLTLIVSWLKWHAQNDSHYRLAGDRVLPPS